MDAKQVTAKKTGLQGFFRRLKTGAVAKIPLLGDVQSLCPIGIDVSGEMLRLVQLSKKGPIKSHTRKGAFGSPGMNLVAGRYAVKSPEIINNSILWQRWAIKEISKMINAHNFRGREVVATIPASDVFIGHIKLDEDSFTSINNIKVPPWRNDAKIKDWVLAKMAEKLPFDTNEAVIRYIPAEQHVYVVIATQMAVVDRHLAIYEMANLQLKTIATWPAALIEVYTSFFGTRKTDRDTIVMLMDMESNCTNIVICRHNNLLFARSIPLGASSLRSDNGIAKLVLELGACIRQFKSLYKEVIVERLIFLSGSFVNAETYTAIAKQLKLPAQMADCSKAVDNAECLCSETEQRETRCGWTGAFGLSLMS